MANFTARRIALMEAAGIVVDSGRTAKDLAARGYKVLGIGRGWDRSNPPSYKLVALAAPEQWLAVIEPLPKGNQGAFTTRLVTRGSRFAKPSGKYATTIAAAHAVADRLERS